MADRSKIHQYERVVVSGEGAKAREIRIYGSGGRLILDGWQVADDSGEVKEMGECSPPFMAELAKALGERWEPA